jgi:hypothetical protein
LKYLGLAFAALLAASSTICSAAGQTLEQLEDSVMLERYKSWANYQQLRAYNVEAAYRNLLTYR